jgi:hypothetical protein
MSPESKKTLAMVMQDPFRIGVLRKMDRGTRAEVCSMLAGPMAEAMAAGEDVWDLLQPPEDEVHEAQGLAQACLPGRDEFEQAFLITRRTLCEPRIWAHVIRLAEEVERLGTVKNPDAFLPPQIPHWPPSPSTSRKRIRRAS